MSRFSELLDDFFYRPDEDVGGLLEFAAGSDEMLPVTPEETPEEYLAFVLEGECYAVPIRSVREIGKVPPLTEIPRAEPHLLGVMNLRGDVIPVYDIKMRLRLADKAPQVAGPDAAAPPRAARIIVAHTEEGPAGVWVDAVRDVVRLKPSMLEQAPPGVGGERDCVVGLGRRNAQLYILLDLQQALA
ncbi:chemotaxis protein CheW [Hyalangium rubrum]|uniref:Chemotaxis protein CheW n=1 Tax=Hyalangium rubrum TaxID=3103134 RepID=A0ABU5H8Y8_9BACT|nr:chemotaxis protein CheW [Hyalangium sp. s54d21]MDY7229941.1 chemotaxis protein CheW [Hyalangium sp. s54d21]